VGLRIDHKNWSIYINKYCFHNWALGVEFYQEYNYPIFEVIAHIFQMNFLFFNITITKWTGAKVIKGV
jgi:hypothetical protein